MLCFGTYLEYVKGTMKDNPSTEDVVRLLFNAIIIPLDLRNKKGEPYDVSKETASRLLNRKNNIPVLIGNKAAHVKVVTSIYGYFEKSVVLQLTKGREDDLISYLTDCINKDDDIGSHNKEDLISKAKMDSLSEFLADVFLYTIKKPNRDMSATKRTSPKSEAESSREITSDVIDKINAELNKLPRPKTIKPTTEIEDHEHVYISALYEAYGDAEGRNGFNEESLEEYPEYKKDLVEQRIDYFAAYSVERGILEFTDSREATQFSGLKDEIYSGVSMTSRKTFSHGYDRLLAVLEQAVKVPVTIAEYIFSGSEFWINSKIKKGTCHYLVIDGRLQWVKKVKA